MPKTFIDGDVLLVGTRRYYNYVSASENSREPFVLLARSNLDINAAIGAVSR